MLRFRKITMAFGLAAAVAVATPAPAANGPYKAPVFVSYFVKAYGPCTNPPPILMHNPPFNFPACTPAVNPGSTMSFGRGGVCRTSGVVLVDSLTRKASDVRLRTDCHDIHDASLCSPSNPCLADGVYTQVATIRITDNNCYPAGPCTLEIPFPWPLYCGTVAGMSPGGCRTRTTANTVVPGMVVGDKDANVEFSQLQIWKGPVLEFVEGLRLP